jgi:hypothetical protein
MLYITSARLMLESEQAVRDHAYYGDEIPRRVCSQLLASGPRYSEWHARHETKMRGVANARRREPQVLLLRAVAIEQVHRTAVVDYLRLGHVTGPAREQTLALFHGVSDQRAAALAEHRTYLLAASTRVCTNELLNLVGDREGQSLVHLYEQAYRQYFAMFCDGARARAAGKTYLLDALLPEVKTESDRLRLQIIGTHLRPMERRSMGASLQHSSSARTPARAEAPPDLPRAGLRSAALPAGRTPKSRTAR